MAKKKKAITVADLWQFDRVGAISLSPDGAQAVCSVGSYSMEENKGASALWLLSTFGGGPRHDARIATANGEALEAGAELALEQERLQREAGALRSQFAAAEAQVAAATQRAALARENRGFYEKSFRLGESDLPTRLRIEAEAFEVERALSSARIGRERTLSQLRQALGLLPE